MLPEFDLDLPENLDQALAQLAEGGASPLAGGTNLLVDLRAHRSQAGRLISLGNIAKMRGIDSDGQWIRIGALTTVSELLQSPTIAQWGPSLADAARVFAGQMVRNTATVAGNIACGSPAADLVPPLLSLDASVTLSSKTGSREVALDEFFTGYKQNARRPDELITAVCWPRPGAGFANLFRKLARRKGDAITVTGIAVMLQTKDGLCIKARIVLGAVAPIVLRATDAEQLLEGRILTADLIDTAASAAVAASDPIDDIRASASYRRHTVHTLTRRLLGEAWARQSGGV